MRNYSAQDPDPLFPPTRTPPQPDSEDTSENNHNLVPQTRVSHSGTYTNSGTASMTSRQEHACISLVLTSSFLLPLGTWTTSITWNSTVKKSTSSPFCYLRFMYLGIHIYINIHVYVYMYSILTCMLYIPMHMYINIQRYIHECTCINIHTYIKTCICILIYMHVYIYAYVYKYTCVYRHAHAYTYMYMYMHVCINVHTCIYIEMHVYINIRTCIHIHISTYTYTYTHIHTYTWDLCIYIYVCARMSVCAYLSTVSSTKDGNCWPFILIVMAIAHYYALMNGSICDPMPKSNWCCLFYWLNPSKGWQISSPSHLKITFLMQ